VHQLLHSRNLRILLILSAYGGFIAGSLNWFGPYLLGKLGGATLIGVSYTSVLLLASISRILGGAFADTIGRRRTIILSLTLRMLAIVPMLLMGINIITATVLILAFELTRFMGAPALSSMIYESTRRETIGRIYATLRLVPQASNVIGAILIGFLAEINIFPQVFALLTLLVIALSTCLKETLEINPQYRKTESFIKAIRKPIGKMCEGFKMLMVNSNLRMLMLVAGIMELTGFMSWIYIPILLSFRGMDPKVMGVVYGLTTLARSIGTAIAGHLVDRYGAYKTIIIDCLTSAPCWLIIALTSDPCITAVAFITNEFIVFSPLAARIAIMDTVNKSIRGTVIGGFTSVIMLMGSVGVALGSVLYNITPSLPFLITGIVWIGIAILVYSRLPLKITLLH